MGGRPAVTFTITPTGLPLFEEQLRLFPKVTAKAMSLAINDTTRDAMPMIKRQIMGEVAFPEGYLDLPKRLYVRQYATDTQLEAIIAARPEPTSLARFTPPGTPVATKGFNQKTKSGVQIRVSPGKSTLATNSFLIGLNNGNVGFAVRLKPGQMTVRGVQRFSPIELFAKYAKPGKPKVFLLYGPSVAQVFQDVRVTLEPKVIEMLEREFIRQFSRLASGQ